tara:strand:+ start:205 stop:318 length:114 start_codon:yes stop_codon:yes gene_type:complete
MVRKLAVENLESPIRFLYLMGRGKLLSKKAGRIYGAL